MKLEQTSDEAPHVSAQKRAQHHGMPLNLDSNLQRAHVGQGAGSGARPQDARREAIGTTMDRVRLSQRTRHSVLLTALDNFTPMVLSCTSWLPFRGPRWLNHTRTLPMNLQQTFLGDQKSAAPAQATRFPSHTLRATQECSHGGQDTITILPEALAWQGHQSDEPI